MLQVGGEISDFVSFYTLPSTVMHHPVHKTLKAAYAFYNVSTRTPWIELMQDALVVAKTVSSRSLVGNAECCFVVGMRLMLAVLSFAVSTLTPFVRSRAKNVTLAVSGDTVTHGDYGKK